MRSMRTYLNLVVACLLLFQVGVATSATPKDCCGADCHGLAQCVSMNCQVCPAATVASDPAAAPWRAAGLDAHVNADATPIPSPSYEIWRPPE